MKQKYDIDELYAVGSKKILTKEQEKERKTDNTDGLIAVYDMKGKLKDEVTFGGSKLERYTGIQALDDKIYVVGISNSLDSDLDIKLNEEIEGASSGFILSYDDELKL